MTENTSPPPEQPQQPAAPPPAAPQPSPLDNLVASMGMSQLLIVGGAAIVVLTDLILWIILREYSAAPVAWAGSAAILLAYFASRRAAQWLPIRYETLLVALAAVVVAVLVRSLLSDIVFFLTPPMGMAPLRLLDNAIYVIAGLMMAYGSWQLIRGQR